MNDPLSDVLGLLKPRSYMSAGFDAAGDWSIQFPNQHDSIKCGAVVTGRCWMTVDGVTEPVLLDTGDCFLLPGGGRAFRLASGLDVPPTDAATIFAGPANGGIVSYNGGGEFFLASSRFALTGVNAGLLLKMLPPIVHIRREADKATLRFAVERTMQELQARQPGSLLVLDHLAHMMLVQALRLYLAEGPSAGGGWLSALADKQIGAAIGLMHADPGRRWTLLELAERTGMSRSGFALKFRQTVGETAMDYLTRWRMVLAGERLVSSTESLATIAFSLGYESETAFSAAFRKVMGSPPRQYARRQASAPENRLSAAEAESLSTAAE